MTSNSPTNAEPKQKTSNSDDRKEKTRPKPEGKEKRAQSTKAAPKEIEPQYLDEIFPEFVVLAKPLAVWTKASGDMGIANSIDELIAITLHAQLKPETAPVTFRVLDEIERYARVGFADGTFHVELGTYLKPKKVSRRPPRRKSKADPETKNPAGLEGIDAAVVAFHWLNRGKLPTWVKLEALERQ